MHLSIFSLFYKIILYGIGNIANGLPVTPANKINKNNMINYFQYCKTCRLKHSNCSRKYIVKRFHQIICIFLIYRLSIFNFSDIIILQ